MAWFNNDWKYRKKITINSSLVDSYLPDYDLTIKLNNEGDISAHAKDDLSDIRITSSDGTSILSHEIAYYNKLTGNIVLNVKTSISSIVDSEIYIYFGNNNTIPSIETNDALSKFNLVSHLNISNVLDTSIPLDKGPVPTMAKLGTNWNIEQKLDWNESPIGYGIELESVNKQAFDIGTITTNTPSIALEAWIRRFDDGDDRIICQAYNTTDTDHDFALHLQNKKLSARLRTNTTAAVTKYGNTDITLNIWHHIAWIWKASTNVLEMYLDGQLDGTHIIYGDFAQSYFGGAYPGIVKTIIGNADSGANDRYFNGDLAEVRMSLDNSYTGEYIKTHYKNITDPTFMTVSDTEVNPSLFDGLSGNWRNDYSDWENRIKFNIKSSSFVGNEDLVNFPFLLNLYSPCLNEASPYGNDVIITDKYSERLPFERFLFRQNIDQQRYAGAYSVDLIGTAQLIQDTNAEGKYRAGYLSGIGNYIRFIDVQILNVGTHNLRIRYSNGLATQATVDIIINETNTYNVNLPPTGSWSTYNTVDIAINWTQEWNTVELGKNSDSPDIDWIQPLEQNTGQLKGFVLLPEVKAGVDTELFVYYGNPNAPIRINPPQIYGQAEVVIQAETMNIVSGYSATETGISFSNGIGLSLYPNAAASGEANKVFTAMSGFYDIMTETIGENDGDNNFIIKVNGINVDTWTTRDLENDPFQKVNHVKKAVWLNTGDTITVNGSGNGTNTWARFGQLNLIPTIMDPNPTWNSNEVWHDYEAVWHLNEVPGESRPFYDGSGNERHLFSYNMSAGTNSVQSSIGAGIKFFDNNDHVYGQFNAMELSKDDFTISMWVQRTNAALNEKEGLLVSDNLNIRFDHYDELKIKFNDETNSGHLPELLEDDYFSKFSFTFNSHTDKRIIRRNGITLIEDIDTNNDSGLNDNLALGRRQLEDQRSAILTEPFLGDMAEVRIKKQAESQLWDANEYKNLLVPQTYVDYGTISCEQNYKEFIIIDAGTTGSINTDGQGVRDIIFERIQTVTTELRSENTLGSLHIERDSVGGINVSGSDILTEFILIRDSLVLISSQTDTTAGIDYVIEFVRMFTGGILSGINSAEADEVSFIPNSNGSLTVPRIDSSHTIDNGFTLDVYFEDTIGGRILSGGAIVNSVARYINIESGGTSWSKGPIVIPVENSYIDNIANGTIYTSGDLQNTHYVYYYNSSDNAIGIVSYPIEVKHTVNYIDNITNGLLETSGTSQDNNQNIFIDNVANGIMFSYGDIDTLLHTVYYYDPSDNAIGTISGNFTPLNIVEFIDDVANGIINITDDFKWNIHYYDPSDNALGTFSYPIEVNHNVEYHPIHLQFITLSKEVTADWILYDISTYGSIKWGKVEASQEISDEWTLNIKITEASKGGVVFSGDVLGNVITESNTSMDSIKIKVSETSAVVEANYFGTYELNTIQIDIPLDLEDVSYNDNTDHVEIITSVSHVEQIDYTPETFLSPTLTAGIIEIIPEYIPITNGIINVICSSVGQGIYVNYEEDFEGGISTKVISEKRKNIYIPEPSGKFSVSHASIIEVEFNFIVPIVGIIKTTGTADNSSVEFLFDSPLNIIVSSIEWDQYVRYDNLEFEGKVIAKTISAPRIFDTTLIPTYACIMGRVAILDDVPYPINSTIYDIYYVENSVASNWYQYRPTGNFDPIANPLYNTGVLGVYNNVVDLPTTGNTIGDVWQIGPCHDGVYYVWTETGWEQDTLYPSILVVNRESVCLVKSKGTAIIETEFITDIEVSGDIKIIDKFKVKTIYSSTVITSKVITSGGHLISGHRFIAIETSLCEAVFSCEETVPTIIRISEAAVLIKTIGSARNSVIFINNEVLVECVLTGFVEEKSVFKPLVNKATLITPSGEVAEPNSVIYYIASPTIGYLSGTALANEVIYKTSEFFEYYSLFSDSGSESYVLYDESNDVAKTNISGEWTKKTEYSVFPNYLLNAHGSAIANSVIYKSINTILVNTLVPSQLFEVVYVPDTSGSIIWNKNTSISISIIVSTDELLVVFYPTGKITTSYYYLEPAVIYEGKSVGSMNIGGSGISQIHYTNTAYSGGSIYINKNVGLDKVVALYKTDSITVIRPIITTIHETNYIPPISTVNLKVSDITAIYAVYYYVPVNAIIKSITPSYGSDEVSYTHNTAIQRKIFTTGEPEVIVDRQLLKNPIEITTTILNKNTVIYKPILEQPHLMIASGVSSPNELHVRKSIVAAKIKLSSTTIQFNIYIEQAHAIITFVSGKDIDNISYEPICEIAKVIGTPIETSHYWEVVRESIPKVKMNGGIPYNQSGQVYRPIVGSRLIHLTGGLTYEEENIYRYLPYNRVSPSLPIKLSHTNVEYANVRNYVYEFTSGGINVHGDYLDPVEFYLTYTGYINIYGSAICRLRYGHEVSVGTILVKLFNPTETEHSEYNKYINDSSVAKAKFRRFTPVPYFTMPSFRALVITKPIKIKSNFKTSYYPIFEPVSKVRLSTETQPVVYIPHYDYIATVETGSVITSGTEHNYELAYTPSNDVDIIVSGNDITIDEFEAHYYPIGGGIVWSKGTITDATDIGIYVNEDANGLIELNKRRKTILGVQVKYFGYEPQFAHLGSIKMWGGGIYHPSAIKPVIVSTIIVSRTEEVIHRVDSVYIVKGHRIKVIGAAQKHIDIIVKVSGSIKVSGKSNNISTYNYITLNDIINVGGSSVVRIDIEREFSGKILVNGIFGGNVIIFPSMDGWLIFGGGIETADRIDYEELDVSTIKLIIVGNMKYRTNETSDLIFHELTNRREFEAGLDDNSLSYPEETWSTLQNFNDLLNDEEVV